MFLSISVQVPGMKTLPTEFTKNGFTHRQIERTGNLAIFERKKPSHSHPHFEVVRIRTSTDSFVTYPDGRSVWRDATELYPPSEAWGKDGFTCRTLSEAQNRLRLCITSS